MEYFVGDRVLCVKNPPDNPCIEAGWLGTVCASGTGSAGVSWDNLCLGHDCGGRCSSGHGWWVNVNNIELVYDGEENDAQAILDANSFIDAVIGMEGD